MPLSIIRRDLARTSADAIVNSANPYPVIGHGVDGALHGAAGETLLSSRRRIGIIRPGQVAVTPAGNLPARLVIHTVGPIWKGGGAGELEVLGECYDNSLAAALREGCRSIAFPLISTGTYGFPKDLALQVAKSRIEHFLDRHDMDVILVVFDEESFQLSRSLVEDVQNFLFEQAGDAEGPDAGLAAPFSCVLDDDETPCFVAAASAPAPGAPPAAHAARSAAPATLHAARSAAPATTRGARSRSLDDVVSQVEESFSEALLRMIDERGMTDPEVYRRANIDRKLFSKIRNNTGYQPKKGTAIGLAVALRLNIDETLDLIGRAGYTLTNASVSDLVVRYFIERQQWDVNDINMVLFRYDQTLIGR